MPKGGKKGTKKNSCNVSSDVKLSDFANSPAAAGRLRKSIGTTLEKEDDEDVSWFERDLDEFQLLNIVPNKKKKQLRSKSSSEESENTPGVRYPIDVWFLIGRYTKPEEVKLFACICKDSYQVSRSYSFWMKMYKRYYQPKYDLPARLQPDCIEQAYCLKTRVIRALYQMYPQFINQLPTRTSNTDVYCLSNLCCTLMWRVQEKGKWLFHFKFQTISSVPNSPIAYRVAIKDLWTSQEAGGKDQDVYVNHNPDECCKVLRFSCSHFVVVSPKVMGSRLSDVRINLAHDMRRQKLQLTFCPSNYRQTINKSLNMYKENTGYCDIVEFDAVENLIVLNWWHPQYPHDFSI